MRELNENEKLAIAGLALFFAGVGAAWLSGVGLWMIAAGLLVLAFAANVRIISPIAAITLGLYVTVTACVMVFHLRGDITDFGGKWLDHVSWLFRVVGASVSLTMFAFLWFVVRERRRVYSELPSAHPPSDLPAAAVSELVDRDEGYRTPFTIVLEMVQKGTLEIVSEGTDSIHRRVYQLEAGPGRKNKWEQTVCDTIPQEPITRFDLLKRLSEPELGLRQQIHDDLQQRGLLHDERSVRNRNVWSMILAVHGVVLMGVGLAFWTLNLGLTWWVGLGLIGVAYVAGMWTAHRQNAMLSEVTDAGRVETRRWRGFGTHLEPPAFDEVRKADLESTNSLMPYAAALSRIHLWEHEPEVSPQRQLGLGGAIAESWRQDKAATLAGFTVGVYIGSYIYPGEGIVESIFDLSDFSAVFGGFGGGGGDGDLGGDGDFGGGDGGDFDISF